MCRSRKMNEQNEKKTNAPISSNGGAVRVRKNF